MNNPDTVSTSVQHLRDEAALRLQDAAGCGDPTRRDALLREALALLNRARVLRDWAETVGNGGAGSPTTGMH